MNPHSEIAHSVASIALLVTLLLPIDTAAGDIVKLGAGTYTTTRPEPCKPLPTKIYKTADFKGAMPTNQWWSSLVFQQVLAEHVPPPARCGLRAGRPRRQ